MVSVREESGNVSMSTSSNSTRQNQNRGISDFGEGVGQSLGWDNGGRIR